MRMRSAACWALALMAGLASSVTQAAEISGRLELISGGRPLRASEAAEAIIYFRPRVPVALVAPAEPAIMTTRRKQFLPRVLAVTAGSTVQFPNEDVILHNAFSSSPGNTFDTGVYGTGEGASHTFRKPGLVKVYCNVHHSMLAHILVLDTPHFTRADAQGRFRLEGLPEGEGELVVFHDRSAPWRETVDPVQRPELDIRVELTTRKVPPHMNKFGKPYGRPADADRY